MNILFRLQKGVTLNKSNRVNFRMYLQGITTLNLIVKFHNQRYGHNYKLKLSKMKCPQSKSVSNCLTKISESFGQIFNERGYDLVKNNSKAADSEDKVEVGDGNGLFSVYFLCVW